MAALETSSVPRDNGKHAVRQLVVSLHDRIVRLRYPAGLRREIEIMFGAHASSGARACHRITIKDEGDNRFTLMSAGEPTIAGLSRGEIAEFVMEAVVRSLICDMKTAVALHAGAVALNDRAILIAGPTGSGKSSLVAWFVANGFGYLSDEIAALTDGEGGIVGLARGIVSKGEAAAHVADMAAFGGAASTRNGSTTIISPPGTTAAPKRRRCGLVVFPRFETGAALTITSMGAAQTSLRLMECNLNARNLHDDGFAAIAALARAAPALALRYGSFEQLEGAIDALSRFLLEGVRDAPSARRLLSIFPSDGAPARVQPPKPPKPPTYDIPSPTPRGLPKTLTIGMATYDDYDGVYFSLQALRLYHPDILDDTEFLVVDNHPDGPCAGPLKALENHVPNYRYVPMTHRRGTAVRDAIFEEAGGEFVLCIDCHVFIVDKAVKRLLDYFRANPDTRDLLQGPLLADDLQKVASHLSPVWRTGFYGTWDNDERSKELDGAPFEIPMQGLGLFACRRAAWPGFNPEFRGFGGEEGYIHEKFRRAGGRTLCLPFLRWVHRFNRPMGIPYSVTWEDRVRNYIIGFREVGLPTTDMLDHFREHLGGGAADRLFQSVEGELSED